MPDWVDRYILYPLTVELSVHANATLGGGVPPAASPVPLSDICCGLAAALSVNEIAPVSVPVAVGVKVTEILQLLLAARVEPQVVVSAKLAEAAMLLIDREPVPVLVKVTVWAVLVVATVWPAKVKPTGDRLTTGDPAAMVMDNCLVAVLPFASVTSKVKALVPTLTGVPDKTPLELNIIPVLHEPLQAGSVHVYGAVPLAAVNVVE